MSVESINKLLETITDYSYEYYKLKVTCDDLKTKGKTPVEWANGVKKEYEDGYLVNLMPDEFKDGVLLPGERGKDLLKDLLRRRYGELCEYVKQVNELTEKMNTTDEVTTTPIVVETD